MSTRESIFEAVAKLGSRPLTEQGVRECLRPLFSRVLARPEIYLANHTLGRPLDCMLEDVAEGAALWPDAMRGAWEPWLAEEWAYRSGIAVLLGMKREDCVVPKQSAGAALRTVLNTLPQGATVLTTDGEFDSFEVVLRRYEALGRLRVVRVAADEQGCWTADAVEAALLREPETRLVVVSHVFYRDGQVFEGLSGLGDICRRNGARLLVDSYHALGVLPFSFAGMSCDYCVGGSYKYLRGGPGGAFLAIAPWVVDSTDVKPLDVGWFATNTSGDAWLESTPAVLPYFQARSGLLFTQAVSVERLRAYGLEQLRWLRGELALKGIRATGGDDQHGAFLAIACENAAVVVQAMGARGVVVDAREGCIRVCPDVLTTDEELQVAARMLFEMLK